MFASTVFPPGFMRASFAVYALLQKFLMVSGVVFLIGLVGLQAGHAGLIDGLKTLLPSAQAADADAEEEEADAPAADAAPTLTPKKRGALDYVSKRYRGSTGAL